MPFLLARRSSSTTTARRWSAPWPVCGPLRSYRLEIGQQFVVVGDDFVSITTETDPDNIKRIANAYQDIVHKIPEQFYPEAVRPLLLIPSLGSPSSQRGLGLHPEEAQRHEAPHGMPRAPRLIA